MCIRDRLQTKVHSGDSMDESALTDPDTNIEYGVYLLSLLSSRYENEITILCAYNAGMGNADRWLKNPETSSDGKTVTSIPYPETRNYVDRVLRSKEMYEKLYGCLLYTSFQPAVNNRSTGDRIRGTLVKIEDFQIRSIVDFLYRVEGHPQSNNGFPLHQCVYRTGTGRRKLINIFGKLVKVFEGFLFSPCIT